MTALFEKKPKQLSISELFPNIPVEEQQAVADTLDAYCLLLLRIFERLDKEHRQDFDDIDSTA